MATKTHTLTEDAEGHKIRKCSEYVITDEAGKVKAVSLLALDGETPIPLNKNFTAVTSPIVAESYATLIANASQVTDKTITISTESAKMLADYCRYRGQQTRNLAFGGSLTISQSGLTILYDNGTITINGTTTAEIYGTGEYWYPFKKTLNAGTYTCTFRNVPQGTIQPTIRTENHGVTVNYTTTTITLDTDDIVWFGMYFPKNKTYTNQVITLQIEQGTTATDFVPPLTTNTTIADANAKGFKVCTEVEGESYELLASLSFALNDYIDSGLTLIGDTSSINVDFAYSRTQNTALLGAYDNTNGFAFSIANSKWMAYNGSKYVRFNGTADTNRHIMALDNRKIYYDSADEQTLTDYFILTYDKNIYIGTANGRDVATFAGYLYSVNINGNIFVPANNGKANGLLNLTTKEFKAKSNYA